MDKKQAKNALSTRLPVVMAALMMPLRAPRCAKYSPKITSNTVITIETICPTFICVLLSVKDDSIGLIHGQKPGFRLSGAVLL